MTNVQKIEITNGKTKDEKVSDYILFTLKLSNTTRASRLEVSGKIDKALQDRILKLLGII
jgi:protein-arginine kinase